MSKISDKTDRFLLNYSYLFWGPLFIGTQCTTCATVEAKQKLFQSPNR